LFFGEKFSDGDRINPLQRLKRRAVIFVMMVRERFLTTAAPFGML